MNDLETFFGYLIIIIPTLLLFFFGYMGLFRTKLVIDFYVRTAEKSYLNSLKKGFFANKYYRALTKYHYEYLKQSSEKKWTYYNMKICCVAALLMATLFSMAIVHGIFNINFGIFKNN